TLSENLQWRNITELVKQALHVVAPINTVLSLDKLANEVNETKSSSKQCYMACRKLLGTRKYSTLIIQDTDESRVYANPTQLAAKIARHYEEVLSDTSTIIHRRALSNGPLLHPISESEVSSVAIHKLNNGRAIDISACMAKFSSGAAQ